MDTKTLSPYEHKWSRILSHDLPVFVSNKREVAFLSKRLIKANFGVVYLLETYSGKKYVGQSWKLSARINAHYRKIKCLRKKFYIIAMSDDRHVLNELETKFIGLYESYKFNKGFNIYRSSGRGGCLSLEHKLENYKNRVEATGHKNPILDGTHKFCFDCRKEKVVGCFYERVNLLFGVEGCCSSCEAEKFRHRYKNDVNFRKKIVKRSAEGWAKHKDKINTKRRKGKFNSKERYRKKVIADGFDSPTMNGSRKYCFSCRTEKPAAKFYKHPDSVFGLSSKCRSCRSYSNMCKYAEKINKS